MVHIWYKEKCLKKNKDCPFSRLECFEHAKKNLFVARFEDVNFAINGKYCKKFNDNPNFYV
jgi:hypothetical protein